MTTETTQAGITERDGVLVGPIRRPRNLAATERASIHDDSVAQKLGFRGGTVAGSIHMEQFPPLLVRAFGQRWFETGSLSTYFRNATMGEEPVQAFVRTSATPAPDTQVDVWMERDGGTLVLEGTASVGSPSEPSLLRRKLSEPREAGELRILAGIAPGDALPEAPARLTDGISTPRLRAITEPLDWYTGPSPWGGPVVNPGLLVHLMVQAQPGIRTRGPAVGLYGAIEVRHLRGPVFAERAYVASGKVLAVGDTPKTEYIWFESQLTEAAGGGPVASMLMMLRFMKGSSPLWAKTSTTR
ncbi:MAG: hypothetical protein WEC75_13155 [Dehalococcoidia bacterium]